MTLKTSDHAEIAAQWNVVRSTVGERWPELTTEDLEAIDGDSRKLVAILHQKTGQDLPTIERELDKIAAQSGGLLQRVNASAQDLMHSASDRVQVTATQTRATLESQVLTNPTRALFASFGIGMLVGLYCVNAARAATR